MGEVSGISVLFTTYDANRYSLPYYYDTSTSTVYYSRELKKLGGIYLTDYYMIVSSAIDDYGEIALNLGNIDSDNNGIDDVCEKEKSFSADVLGNWYSQDGTIGAISGTINRTAGNQQGHYSLLIHNTGAGNVWFSGSFFIGTIDGSINYTMFSKNIEIDFTTTWDDYDVSPQFSTTYDIIDQDTIRINGTEDIPDTTLYRSGNTYSAIFELIDGNSGTFWPDYQKWFITITDNNDSDSDGIPDLSDACPSDPNKNSPGICGCGVSDIDTDIDGTVDCVDTDDDNDGFTDAEEAICGSNPVDSRSKCSRGMPWLMLLLLDD